MEVREDEIDAVFDGERPDPSVHVRIPLACDLSIPRHRPFPVPGPPTNSSTAAAVATPVRARPKHIVDGPLNFARGTPRAGAEVDKGVFVQRVVE